VVELSAPSPFSPPCVELLCWSECPSHEHARKVLHEALEDLGYDGAAVTYIWVEDDDAASEQQFVGSPTFRVDGADLFPPLPGEQYGLSCRMYTRRDGRPSPLPDPDDLRDALRAALGPRVLSSS
jgi:hypothetical protein